MILALAEERSKETQLIHRREKPENCISSRRKAQFTVSTAFTMSDPLFLDIFLSTFKKSISLFIYSTQADSHQHHHIIKMGKAT
jgi:hypothetical protein